MIIATGMLLNLDGHTLQSAKFQAHIEASIPLKKDSVFRNLLSYGYAILRAVVARSLVASGLLPTLSIFHKNQYNAYCLADDILEPYRPYVDNIVLNIVNLNGNFLELTPSMKKDLLNIPAMDITINNEKSPLMVAVQRTTASLVKCFEGKQRKLLYPEFV